MKSWQQLRQNNPFVIFALLLTLGGSLTKTYFTLTSNPHAAMGPGSKAAASAPVAETEQANASPAFTPVSDRDRDPFYHPAVLRLAVQGEEKGQSAPGGHTDVALPPSLVPTPGMSKPVSMALAPVPIPPATAPSPSPVLAQPKDEPAGWQLTAILRGDEPIAVLAMANGQQRRVKTGDRLGAYRIASIGAQEIVVEGDHGIWTVPIQAGNGETEQTGGAAGTPLVPTASLQGAASPSSPQSPPTLTNKPNTDVPTAGAGAQEVPHVVP